MSGAGTITSRSSGAAHGLRRLALWLIATGFGVGLVPLAPATAGSAVAILLYAWLPLREPTLLVGAAILAGFGAGIWITGQFVTAQVRDPKYVVWDEFVGMWIACLWVPRTAAYFAAAFCLFRFFDVAKPFPIRRLEHLPGGLGIMADDALAAVYTGLVLHAWLLLRPLLHLR